MPGIYSPRLSKGHFCADLQDGYRIGITFAGPVWKCSIVKPVTIETFTTPHGEERPRWITVQTGDIYARFECDNPNFVKQYLSQFFAI